MALNREQIKDGFYLSVECPEIILGYATYYYDINILKKDYIELTYGEQYTYYVTSDNKKMNFLINGLSFDEYPSDQTNFRISIWARGNKNVTSQLEGGNFTKHSRYNGYIIQLKERKDYNYFLTVEGTIGDLINVGAIDIGSEKNRFEYDIEYTGFLKRDILDQITFCINIACDIYSYSVLYVNAYDYNKSEIKYEIDKLEYKRYVTIYLPKDLDELFFSFHYLTYESVSVEKITYSLRTGNNYEMLIGKSYTFGFIPKWIAENYNYITYNIFQIEKNIEAFILSCDNYPMCLYDTNYENKLIPIQKYLSTLSISYTANEFGKVSPMSKNQKILILKCVDEGYGSCKVNINIYTDKELIMPVKTPFQYKFIREGNQDNLFIKYYDSGYKNNVQLIFITIEKLSGDFSLNHNNSFYEHYTYNNIHFYITNMTNEENFFITINAKKDSVYSIKYYDKLHYRSYYMMYIYQILGEIIFLKLIQKLVIFKYNIMEHLKWLIRKINFILIFIS